MSMIDDHSAVAATAYMKRGLVEPDIQNFLQNPYWYGLTSTIGVLSIKLVSETKP